MLDLEKHAQAILEQTLTNGGRLAELFFEESSRTNLRFEDGKIERVVSGTEVGVGIRLLAGERTFYAHTNDVALDRVLDAAATVAGGASAERGEYRFDFRPERFPLAVRRPAHEVPAATKADLVKQVDAVARAYDRRVVQVNALYADSVRRVTVVNSMGRFVEEARPQTLLRVEVVAEERGVIQRGYKMIGGTLGFDLFDDEDPEAVALESARQACLMLGADPAPTGRMPVVIDSAAGGTMIHEAVGHGLEADHIEKGMSKYCGRLGTMIAVPEVTVIDDATLPQRRGSFHVDDEGTPAQRTVLIDQGRLVQFLNDLRTARKMGHEPTGNGRRESYQSRPIPRMSNTLIAPGLVDPASILTGTSRGLYVRQMGGGEVNPLNGDFVFEVREGYRIKGGEAETPVRGATLIGNGPDVLMAIEAVGRDLGFGLGTCGKDGQGAPVADAQPTIRIREMTIGGTAP
ncbi:MAG TPA: TldD/PmbA family protein [Candidatus Hydrogenedentes bacterium]|nr:TldD/PmbA family protein [Candidatus Hydrogenedentota bacterium]